MSAIIAQAVTIGRQVAAQYRADAYQVRRTTRVSDGGGGTTETIATVEAGTCVLTAGATRPEEKAIADQAGSTTPYVARNLPWDTALTAADTLLIAGRTLEVLGVLRAAAVNVAVTAVCEERT